jgi:membrane-bound inhibitor of C-type lysozyme
MLSRTKCFTALASGALLVSGCSLWPWSVPEPQAPRLPADTRVYSCDGNKRLMFRPVNDSKSMMLMFPEREFRLDRGAAGQYTNGHTTLTVTGDEARLEEAGSVTLVNCRVEKGAR